MTRVEGGVEGPPPLYPPLLGVENLHSVVPACRPTWYKKASLPVLGGPLPLSLVKELRATYRLVYRDLSASVIPGILTTASAAIAQHASPATLARRLAAATIYFVFYIYIFCITNQLIGIEEDRINKRDRPLACGAWSWRGAWLRLIVSYSLFPSVAYALGGWPIARLALAWQLMTVGYNLLLHRHWFTKNIVFITGGTILLLAAAWQLVAPLSPPAWRWILYVAGAFGVTLHLQDLRDVAGDRQIGRLTLPLAIGEEPCRVVLALLIGVLPLLTHHFVMAPNPPTPTRAIVEVVLATFNVLVAARVLLRRSAVADAKTYLLHTYWFCAILCSAGFVMRAS